MRRHDDLMCVQQRSYLERSTHAVVAPSQYSVVSAWYLKTGVQQKQGKSRRVASPLSKPSNTAWSHSALERHNMVCQLPLPRKKPQQSETLIQPRWEKRLERHGTRHQAAQESWLTPGYNNEPASSTRFKLDLPQNKTSDTFPELSAPC